MSIICQLKYYYYTVVCDTLNFLNLCKTSCQFVLPKLDSLPNKLY